MSGWSQNAIDSSSDPKSYSSVQKECYKKGNKQKTATEDTSDIKNKDGLGNCPGVDKFTNVSDDYTLIYVDNHCERKLFGFCTAYQN